MQELRKWEFFEPVTVEVLYSCMSRAFPRAVAFGVVSDIVVNMLVGSV